MLFNERLHLINVCLTSSCLRPATSNLVQVLKGCSGIPFVDDLVNSSSVRGEAVDHSEFSEGSYR